MIERMPHHRLMKLRRQQKRLKTASMDALSMSLKHAGARALSTTSGRAANATFKIQTP